MIKEALQYISGLATEALKPVALDTADPTNKTYMVGKEVVRVSMPIPSREHHVRSLDDFMAVILQDRGVAAVFVDETSAWGILDYDAHRDEFVEFILVPS